MDQSNVTEDADVDVVHSEIFEGARLSDVLEVLVTIAGDALNLNDEVFRKELLETLDIVRLVGVDVVEVELLEGRQVFSRLLGVANFLCSFCVRFTVAAGGVCTTKGVIVKVVSVGPSRRVTTNVAVVNMSRAGDCPSHSITPERRTATPGRARTR